MTTKRVQSLDALKKQKMRIEAQIKARKDALAIQIGKPFVDEFGDRVTAKEATALARSVKQVGFAQALSKLAG